MQVKLVVKASHFNDCGILVPEDQGLGDDVAAASEGGKDDKKPSAENVKAKLFRHATKQPWDLEPFNPFL